VRPGGFGEPADGNASAENWDGSTPSRDKAIDVLAPFEEQVAACRAELVAELQASEPTSERRSMDGFVAAAKPAAGSPPPQSWSN
jgi:hypothetical protein